MSKQARRTILIASALSLGCGEGAGSLDLSWVSPSTSALGECGTASSPAALGLKCDDGNACTSSDQCDGQGACVGSAPSCPPNTDCRTYAPLCDRTPACLASAINVGAFCKTADGGCAGGRCDATGRCVAQVFCPNDICEADVGESIATCPQDCLRGLLHFKFDEPAGAGSVLNSGTLTPTNPTAVFAAQGVAGMLGRAIQFNGATHGVQIPDNAALDAFTKLTIEGWISYADLNSGAYSTLAKKENAYICRAYSDTSTNVYQLQFALWNTALQLKAASIARPNLSAWYHLACTWDGASRTMKIYWNGAPAGSWVVPGNAALAESSYALVLGRHQVSGENLIGRLDNVKLWDLTLTPEQLCEASERAWCNGACTDTRSDPNNCGGCGQSCDDASSCTNDACVSGACQHTSNCDDGNPCTVDYCSGAQCQSAWDCNACNECWRCGCADPSYCCPNPGQILCTWCGAGEPF